MNTIVPAIGFGIVTASILAVAGVGFTLQFGVTNILNLAYGDIMTAAAFVAYLVTSAGLSVWLALVAGAAFGSVFSVLLNRCIYTPFVRRGTRLFGMIIVTIAVSLILQNTLLAIFGANFFSADVIAAVSASYSSTRRTLGAVPAGDSWEAGTAVASGRAENRVGAKHVKTKQRKLRAYPHWTAP